MPVVAVSYARAWDDHARARSSDLWTDCTVERDGDSCSGFVRSALSAITLATVEIVGALVRPDTAVDGACDANCHTDDGANHHECDQDANGQSLVLAVAGPVVFERATCAGTAGATLLLVFQASLPESLVCGPHGAFLVVAADCELLAERVLVVGASVGGDVAVFKVLL